MYYLESLDNHKTIATFEKFDREAIKEAIVKHLADNPLDYIEYSKDFKLPTRYAGTEHLAFFANNPVSNQPCKVILKGEREFYKPLTIN
jgi:hypothetical protein